MSALRKVKDIYRRANNGDMLEFLRTKMDERDD